MKDVLSLLPPDTIITGAVGDHGSYVSFKLSAAVARAKLTSMIEELRVHNAVNQVCPTCGEKQYSRCHIDQLDRGLITFLEPNERYAEICALTPSCVERVNASKESPYFTEHDVKVTLPNGVVLTLSTLDTPPRRGDVRTDPWVVIGVDMTDALLSIQDRYASNDEKWSQPDQGATNSLVLSILKITEEVRQYLP